MRTIMLGAGALLGLIQGGGHLVNVDWSDGPVTILPVGAPPPKAGLSTYERVEAIKRAAEIMGRLAPVGEWGEARHATDAGALSNAPGRGRDAAPDPRASLLQRAAELEKEAAGYRDRAGRIARTAQQYREAAAVLGFSDQVEGLKQMIRPKDVKSGWADTGTGEGSRAGSDEAVTLNRATDTYRDQCLAAEKQAQDNGTRTDWTR